MIFRISPISYRNKRYTIIIICVCLRFCDACDSDGHTDGRHVPDGPQVANVRADIRGVDQQRRGPDHHDPDTRAPVDQHAALPEEQNGRQLDDRIGPFPA